MIQRYEKTSGEYYHADSMTPEEMKWCRASEVTALQAENERLKAQLVRWKHGEKFISKRHEKLRVRAISREMYELRDERYSPLAGWTASRVDDVDLWFHRDHAAAIRKLCEEFDAGDRVGDVGPPMDFCPNDEIGRKS